MPVFKYYITGSHVILEDAQSVGSIPSPHLLSSLILSQLGSLGNRENIESILQKSPHNQKFVSENDYISV